MDLPKYAFFQGKIVPYSEAKVGVLTHGLNYGTAAFGGIRAYWNEPEQQLYLFRPIEHYTRFLNSTKILLMNLGQSPESLLKITLELLALEQYRRDIYIRPLAYKADESIGVKLHGIKDELSIVAIPSIKYFGDKEGIHVTISSWRRVDDNVIPARGKIAGAYANSALIKSDAALAGYDEALTLNQDGHLSEGSAMNFFMVRNGILTTPPVTDNILEGITRRSVLELAASLGIPVQERPIDRTEVFVCEELFLSGTAVEVTPVLQVDHRTVGEGKVGPITTAIRQKFAKAVRAEEPEFRAWNVPVYPR
jgi:branched-chain amino acid aminotransferase